jgi:hypothetical protein
MADVEEWCVLQGVARVYKFSAGQAKTKMTSDKVCRGIAEKLRDDSLVVSEWREIVLQYLNKFSAKDTHAVAMTALSITGGLGGANDAAAKTLIATLWDVPISFSDFWRICCDKNNAMINNAELKEMLAIAQADISKVSAVHRLFRKLQYDGHTIASGVFDVKAHSFQPSNSEMRVATIYHGLQEQSSKLAPFDDAQQWHAGSFDFPGLVPSKGICVRVDYACLTESDQPKSLYVNVGHSKLVFYNGRGDERLASAAVLIQKGAADTVLEDDEYDLDNMRPCLLMEMVVSANLLKYASKAGHDEALSLLLDHVVECVRVGLMNHPATASDAERLVGAKAVVLSGQQTFRNRQPSPTDFTYVNENNRAKAYDRRYFRLLQLNQDQPKHTEAATIAGQTEAKQAEAMAGVLPGGHTDTSTSAAQRTFLGIFTRVQKLTVMVRQYQEKLDMERLVDLLDDVDVLEAWLEDNSSTGNHTYLRAKLVAKVTTVLETMRTAAQEAGRQYQVGAKTNDTDSPGGTPGRSSMTSSMAIQVAAARRARAQDWASSDSKYQDCPRQALTFARLGVLDVQQMVIPKERVAVAGDRIIEYPGERIVRAMELARLGYLGMLEETPPTGLPEPCSPPVSTEVSAAGAAASAAASAAAGAADGAAAGAADGGIIRLGIDISEKWCANWVKRSSSGVEHRKSDVERELATPKRVLLLLEYACANDPIVVQREHAEGQFDKFNTALGDAEDELSRMVCVTRTTVVLVRKHVCY